MNVAKGDCRKPLGSSEASVKGALQRARATLEARLPAGREHAPPAGLPPRTPARRFAAAVETSDIDAVLDLLTSDAWLTKPVLAENVVLTGQAACWYSWMTPPARSRRRTRKASRSVISAGSGLSGAALDRAI